MRIRGIKFWENKISEELTKTTDQQFISQSPQPQNPTEEQNYQIASYFVHQQQNDPCKDKKNKSHYKQVA